MFGLKFMPNHFPRQMLGKLPVRTDVRTLSSWSDACSGGRVFWYFKRAPGTFSVAGHSENCGWSYYGASSSLHWYGPHQNIKVHLNAGTSHISIPGNITSLGSDQGCGFGWVK